MNYGLVNTGVKIEINAGIVPKQGESTPGVTFYIQIEDPQVYLEKAVSLDGEVVLSVTEIPSMLTFAQFADPDGNVVGLVKEPQAPPKKKAKKSFSSKKTG